MREGPFGLPWFWKAVLGIIAATTLVLFGAAFYRTQALTHAARIAAANYTPAPLDIKPVAVFLGDSYTQGVGSSNPDKSWAALVSAEEGWAEDNLGAGGTGYDATSGLSGCGQAVCDNYQTVAKLAIRRHPEIVIVAGGQNDFTTWADDRQKETAAIENTFKTLRAGLPKARIIAVGPSTPGTVTPLVTSMSSEVQKAAKSVGASFVSLTSPNPIKPSYLLSDKEHVDDAGHAAIADAVLKGIR